MSFSSNPEVQTADPPEAPSAVAHPPKSRRFFTAAGIAGVLVVALLVSGLSGEPAPQALVTESGSEQAPTSAAFCAATNGSQSAGVLSMDNQSDQAIVGLVDLVGLSGATATAPITVPAAGQATVRPADLINEAIVGATARFQGTGVRVSHEYVSGGQSPVACVEEASDKWVFLEATTESDAGLQLVLYNPFSDEAVADVSLDTNAGPVSPTDLQGVVVPARGVVSLDIAARVKRREWVVPDVDVRRGRVVAELLQTPSNLAGAAATHAIPGVTEPHRAWVFDPAVAAAGSLDQLAVFNPGDSEVGARVQLSPTDGTEVQPFVLRVPARGRVLLNLHDEPRVPAGVPFAVEVRSEDQSPILASRATGAPQAAAVGSAQFRPGMPLSYAE